MTLDAEWIQKRIDRCKELIVAYEDAIEAVLGGAQSYTLDTGQTRQTVTKADVASLQNKLSSMENRLVMLNQQLCGGGSSVLRGI